MGSLNAIMQGQHVNYQSDKFVNYQSDKFVVYLSSERVYNYSTNC